MKIQPYIEKLGSSEEYKKFMQENTDAFMVAGFFVLDFETKQNLHQIDYYVPSKKKVAAFTLDEKINIQMLNLVGNKIPEKMDMQTKIDLEALQGILEDEMKNRNISEEIKKIIAVIQNIKGKKIWNLNCVLTGMELLNAHVEDETQTVLKMEKISMMDLIKKMPPEAMQKLKAQAGGVAGEKMQAPKQQHPQGDSEEAKKEKIKKLEQLEKAIEKEKDKIQHDAQKSILKNTED